MKKTHALLLSLVLLPGWLVGQDKQNPQTNPLVFTHVTVIDATGAPAQSDMTVIVTGDRITEISRTEKISIPKDAQVVDAGGKFLIPGLWDMHVHTWYQKVAFLPLFIANGVTGVRDVHAPLDHFEQIKQWRQEIASGKLLGPRIFTSGPLVDGPKPQHASFVVTSPAGGREVVDALKRRGADFVKVYDWLSRDSYYAVIDEAKKQGLPYTGHVPYSVSAAEASDIGQHIEHLKGVLLACSTDEARFQKQLAEGSWSPDDTDLLDTYSEEKAAALFARFVKNGTWHTPTLVITWKNLKAYAMDDADFNARIKYIPRGMTWPVPREAQYGGVRVNPSRDEWDPKSFFRTREELENTKRRFEKYLQIVGGMHRMGVQFMTGTDTGAKAYLIPGFSLHDELVLLVQAGLTPLEALQAATRNPAKYLGLSDSLGTVEKGKIADLVLLEANPLEQIRNTQRIAAVVVGGKFISKASLQEMLANIEAAADKGK
ncbi:MAG: amidohydrolase family protein [Acidobacteria bacterium]|nr:amidohydrolase family protein [Acidobacteriota bacterium]